MSHWSTKSVFYHIYPLGFCGAPEYNDFGAPVQRLEQLRAWIPHLKELGVNALYLGPVFQSVKHGYDTADYFQIDCRLGDNQSFAKLCGELHENGIRVVLDGVFNHVGRAFWAFKDVQEKGQASPYCGWFHNLNFGGPSPMGDPFWYDSWQGHYELVKLNLRNPQVVDHLLEAVTMWMDAFHIDGLRLDAADCVDFDFFRTLKGFVKDRNPEFWLMGEIIHGDYARWANPEMLDSVTNYECWKGLWSSHNDKNYFEIAHSLHRQFGPGGIYRNLSLYNFADNHDVDRLASKLTNPDHIRNLYTLLYTMPGIPSLYYGSEWALKGARTKTSDAALRPHLELAEMEQLDQSLCAHLGKLAAIRAAFPALREGGYENVLIKNQQLVFRRATDSQRVYVVLNLEPEEVHVEFKHNEPVLQDVLNDNRIFNNDGGRTWLPVPPCSARILVGAPDKFAWPA
ncbi:alpha-amylase family glycosyl hydrolase [uncultured Flavonifractor sp.]|uniref:alpha-amylase family glycosyl hydrolase n=1 Tax=uncultured Flavonifractor sp. TaxID=1193534 RepID=UPI00261861F6|nr:alpha-amylase family glycosyl hydrolase [uncultured Flavonifractor sp.]